MGPPLISVRPNSKVCLMWWALILGRSHSTGRSSTLSTDNINFLCRVKPYGGGILQIRGLGWGDSWVQPHFENVYHLWALPIVRHKANLIIWLNMHRSWGIGVGRFLHLLLKSERNITHSSRCKIKSPLLRSTRSKMSLFYEKNWQI